MEKIIKKFKEITTEKDLRKNNLSLSDHKDLAMTLQSVIDVGSGTTLIKNVADWCKKNGLKVQEESICYRVFNN
jgi:5-enolpyruvylshikimate-3-phosphate synthase